MSDPIGKYRTCLAVSEAGSVSEAARRLFVSQPAVSADIAGLEAQLGVRLFHRSRHGVTLTEAGTVLLQHVKSAFTMLEAGREKLRELADLESGTLRIGASDMTLRYYLLDPIATFHHRYPGIRLTVTNAPTPRTLAALREGAIDFGVVSGPLSPQEDLCAVPVRKISDVFVAAPGHPLAGRTGITREELAAYPMMMLEGNTSTRAYIEAWLGPGFSSPTISLATFDLLLEFAKRGLGIAPVIEDVAAPVLSRGEVVRLRLAEEPPPREFYLVFSARLSHSAAALGMLSLLREEGAPLDRSLFSKRIEE